MNTSQYAICESKGRPTNVFASAGHYIGARALLGSLPNVDWLLEDQGCDADWLRDAFQNKGLHACSHVRKKRKTTVKYHPCDIAGNARPSSWPCSDRDHVWQ
ncbi:hypothetical protein KO516_17605, partial [Citreicella sp. C3M06]|nr:hypothetical protein [Citreicella sp. C3M06]